MRGLFSQVLKRDGSSGDPPPTRQEPVLDTADAMGCFASPKRLGHHGSISDVCVISYEPSNGLMAVASRGGMVKVFGGPGVELVLEEEGTSIAGEDPPAHLLFPTSSILVGVTATGAVLSWDLAAGGRSGTIPSPVDPGTGLEERVTSVHSAAASEAQRDRYVFTGFEGGRVRITQVYPVCRASGYTVEPRETSSGAPEGLLAPGGDYDAGKSLGAVTSISSFGDRDGGGVGVFGHRYGGIVVWDWVRRKRLALRSLSSHHGADERRSHGSGDESEDDREVSSLAFHPSGQVFAAGYTSGCYAIFSASSSLSSSQDYPSPRWVREVWDDGSCPREGPTIVRSGVSLVQWVSVRGAGAKGALGLVVAGGVEMEEGEEPDGVSLLVPASPASAENGSGGGGGGGRAKKKDIVEAAMAVLETAAFVPFATGQERLSHVHCVVSGPEKGVAATAAAGGLFEEAQPDAAGEETQVEQELAVDAFEELVILGLVKWNEEIRGDDGRLHFRLASSILACPIQTSPYVALRQLSPEKFGPNVGGFAAVTAVASTPLLSSSTILDFMTCLGNHQQAEGGEGKTGGSPALSSLLRGGHLRWPDSVPPRARDEALCTSELLVAGHSDGLLTFWECCGPASRQDAVAISEGRVIMREVPSGALLLGSVSVAELAGKEDGAAGVAVSSLDVWVERDRVAAAAARNACWVAVGFDNGDATVIVLSNRMEAGSSGSNGGFGSTGGGGGRAESGGGTPLAEKPVEVSDVQLRGETIEDSVGGGGLLKRFVKRGGSGQQQSPRDDEAGVEEDAELEAAIAEARAEAREIAEREGSTIEDPEKQGEPSAQEEAGKGEEGESVKQESKDLRQKLLEAMSDEGTAGDSGMPPLPPRQPPPPADTPEDGEGRGAGENERPLCLDTPRKASLVQLSLRLHSLSVRCVTLSFDSAASALALVVADEGGVVSVTDISTGSASLLPMRVPQSRPCRPSVAIGPLPGALSDGRAPALGASGALFVLLEGWLNVFDLASRDPVDFVQVPGLAPPDSEGGGGRGGGGGTNDAFTRSRGRTARQDEGEGKSWLACVDERGLPLLPYATESFCSSFSPPPAASKGQDGGGGGGGGGGDVDCDDDEASGGRGEIDRDALSSAQTIWVTPPASRTALDDNHERELQALNNPPPPEPFLLVVRGAMAVVLAIAQREPESASSSMFSRRNSDSSHPSANAAAFKGKSGAELVVKSRGALPRAEGHAAPPRVDGAGVCLVPAGKGQEGGVARRGCLVAADSSGFVTGLLLPSLSPIFRDQLPASGDARDGGARALAQESVCNLVGELTCLGMAGELTRWSLLTDEACDKLTGSRARLVKVSALARPPAMSRQSSGGGNASSSGSAAPKGRSARGMLGRLSLGGSKKSVADVFAAEPSPRRQSVSRESSVGGGGFGSTRSSFTSSAGGTGSIRATAGRDAASAQAQGQREALFGERQAGHGVTAARDGAVGGVGGASGGVSGTHAAVSEARDLAIERGEKLENLVDRSRQLEDSAMAFGDMAKQLRRQQEDESCCVS